MMGLLHSARTLDFFFFVCCVVGWVGWGILKTWNTCMKIIPYHYLYSLGGIYISIWCITKSSQIWGFSHHELEEAFSLRMYLFPYHSICRNFLIIYVAKILERCIWVFHLRIWVVMGVVGIGPGSSYYEYVWLNCQAGRTYVLLTVKHTSFNYQC